MLQAYQNFLPLHWTILQLYSKEVFKSDIFQQFLLTEAPLDFDRDLGMMSMIILDEAQILDLKLEKMFPTRTKPDVMRSLLSPVVQTLSEFPGQFIVRGTGLSAASVYDATISPIKYGGRDEHAWGYGVFQRKRCSKNT